MVLLSAIGAMGAISSAASASVGYETLRQGKALYHVVTVNTASGAVGARTTHANGLASVRTILGRCRPVAAITGTFFSPMSRRPVADFLVEGDLVARGSIGSAVAVEWYGNVRIFDPPHRVPVDWSTYRFGLRGAVRVVSKGQVQPNPKAQKFNDKKIWGRAARTGIGIRANGKLVLIATAHKVTLSELGRAMRAKGVVDGVSLDGGGSTCLYYKGALVVPPKRLLNNLFVIEDNLAPL